MKTFKIGIYEEQSGYITIKAKNRKEAEEKVFDLVTEFGLDELQVEQHGEFVFDFNVKHRDIQITN